MSTYNVVSFGQSNVIVGFSVSITVITWEQVAEPLLPQLSVAIAFQVRVIV
jgi:hypothetical protein